MESKFCQYCGKQLTENDHLEGCCNWCAEKLEHEWISQGLEE
jgi:predicted amidophosphoribosyltransferase